jgi:glycosyltransferase involved in cell wall biosynthesis
VAAEDIPKCMDAGDVFAMPCRTRLFGLEVEAFGIVFLEAAACGLPVVAGDSGGAQEVITMLSERGDVVANAEALRQKLMKALVRNDPASLIVHGWRLAALLLKEIVEQ